MKLLFKNNIKAYVATGSVVTIGNFDGVHVGHQRLLNQLYIIAKNRLLPAIVVLFEPQPSEFFSTETSKPRLSSLREKLKIIATYGIDYVYCLRFDENLAAMTPRLFVDQILIERLNTKLLLLGQDFRFGKARHGNIEVLSNFIKNKDCELSIFPDYLLLNAKVSSTRIRKALALANFKHASLLLGRLYSLLGRVQEGAKLAREWGVSTANIHISRNKMPFYGVFCVRVQIVNSRRSEYRNKLFNGIANLGFRPTIGGTRVILEVHLFDFHDNLYGEILEVFFLHKLRDEIKFDNITELVNQIHIDLSSSIKYFLNKV